MRANCVPCERNAQKREDGRRNGEFHINRGEMERAKPKTDELRGGRARRAGGETLENKRRKSPGPIHQALSRRKYIMQSGIGKVVVRQTVAANRQEK